MGLTACFLPKPVVGVNGSGMHTNVSITKDGKNLFWDPKGEEKLSKFGWEFVDRILTHGNDICLLLNSSVNAYRRLDPHFEAPEPDQGFRRRPRFHGPHSDRQRAQHARRSSLRRSRRESLPGHATRIFKTGLDGDTAKIKNLRQAERYLPDNIYDALDELPERGVDDEAAGRRCEGPLCRSEAGLRRPLPAPLGTFVKAQEVQFHHEVYNQFLWNLF